MDQITGYSENGIFMQIVYVLGAVITFPPLIFNIRIYANDPPNVK